MLLIHFVAAAQELKILFITSFTVPTFHLDEIPFNEIAIVDRSIIDQDDIKIIQTFLYGNPSYSVNDNRLILDASIKYILETKRFEAPIF